MSSVAGARAASIPSGLHQEAIGAGVCARTAADTAGMTSVKTAGICACKAMLPPCDICCAWTPPRSAKPAVSANALFREPQLRRFDFSSGSVTMGSGWNTSSLSLEASTSLPSGNSTSLPSGNSTSSVPMVSSISFSAKLSSFELISSKAFKHPLLFAIPSVIFQSCNS